VVTILAVFATLAAMGPTIDRINAEAVAPYRAGVHADAGRLWMDAERPVRDFMFAQMDATGGDESLAVMMEARGVSRDALAAMPRSRVPITALIPAFMLSELKTAFVMGLKILLPFLVIDLVVGAVLLSMGMVMLPPAVVALPFKVLLFVAVDGWTLVVGSLMRSVAQPGAGALGPALTMIGGGG
jgi:flagellar biosynthetic protein FliP